MERARVVSLAGRTCRAEDAKARSPQNVEVNLPDSMSDLSGNDLETLACAETCGPGQLDMDTTGSHVRS